MRGGGPWGAGQGDLHAGLGLDPAHVLDTAHGSCRHGSQERGGAGAAAGGGGRGVTYGRTVVIECDGRPAAEVLEVVVP